MTQGRLFLIIPSLFIDDDDATEEYEEEEKKEEEDEDMTTTTAPIESEVPSKENGEATDEKK